MRIGPSGRLGSGAYAGNIALGGTLEFSSSLDQTLSGVISGSGALVKDNGLASTLTLTGVNTYGGGTTVNSGTLNIGGGGPTGSIPTAAVTVASGATLVYNLSTAYTAPPLTVAGNLYYISAAQLGLSGTYGADQLSASGVNLAVNGALTINAGPAGATITGSSASVGGIASTTSRNITATGNVTFMGSTTGGQYVNGISLAGVFTDTTGTLTFDGTAGSGDAFGFENGVSGAWGGNISTFGNVVFKGTGGGGGTGGHNSDLNLGNLTGNGTVTLIGRARGLLKNSTFTASGGKYNVVLQTTAGDINGILGAGTDTTSGGNYTINSAGAVVFGGRTINAGAGTISLTSGSGYSVTANSTLQSVALTIGDANTITIASGVTLTLSTTGTIPNPITGAGAIAIGGGSVNLAGDSSYSGGTNVNRGTLRVTNFSGSATGSGLVSVGDGTNPATLAGATASGEGSIGGSVHVNYSALITAASDASLTIGGDLSLDDGSLSSFALTTDGADNATPLIAIGGALSSAGVHTIGLTGNVAVGTYNLFGFTGTAPDLGGFTLGNKLGSGYNEYLAMGSDQLDLIVALSASSGAWNFVGNGAYGDSTNFDPALVPNGAGLTATFGAGTTNPINLSTVPSGAISVAIDGAYTVGSMVFDNSAVSYTLANDSVSGHGLTLDSGSGAGTSIVVNSGSHTIAANLTLADAGGNAFALAGGTNLTVSGSIGETGGSHSISLSGGGMLTLSNADTYSGGTTVAAGTLRTPADGALGSGPLALNSTGGATVVNVGGNEAVGGLSSAVSGGGSAAVNVAAGKSLGVNPAASATFGGSLALASGSSLSKSGGGTEVLTAAPQLGDNAALNVSGGTLRIAVASGAASVGNMVTANVSGSGTLELAGTVSALGTATVAERTNVTLNSASSTLLVSGGNQIVGGIDGSGNVQIDAGTSLTADYATAGSLVIGGDATHSALLTIAASDTNGDPTASSGFALAGSLAPGGSSAAGSLSSSSPIAGNSASSAGTTLGLSGPGSGTLGASAAAVPEPSTLLLLVVGLLGGLLPGLRRLLPIRPVRILIRERIRVAEFAGIPCLAKA